MNEYVKGLMKAVRLTRADLEAAQREYDAAVQELLGELDKEARGEVQEKKGEAEKKEGGEPLTKQPTWVSREERETKEKGRESVGPHTHARDTQGPAHGTSSTHGCSRCCSSTHAATPTGTHATQVPASTRVDTTSRK